LPAFRTPGGHRRIRTSDLLVFMRSHQMPIPSALRPSLARRVMLVDDEPALLVSTRRILQRVAPGIEVETFDSAISALLSVTAFRPDLIIFDIFMPALDGLQACRRLKARPDTAGIQLVITSGALTDDLRREAFEIGVHACLSKPFGPEELIAAIGTELTPIED
jgi:CheY-like chemotaxis protein